MTELKMHARVEGLKERERAEKKVTREKVAAMTTKGNGKGKKRWEKNKRRSGTRFGKARR